MHTACYRDAESSLLLAGEKRRSRERSETPTLDTQLPLSARESARLSPRGETKNEVSTANPRRRDEETSERSEHHQLRGTQAPRIRTTSYVLARAKRARYPSAAMIDSSRPGKVRMYSRRSALSVCTTASYSSRRSWVAYISCGRSSSSSGNPGNSAAME